MVQRITEREKSLLWLPNYAREQLAAYGEDFLKQGRLHDLHWIVEHLQFDPDPPVEASDGQLTDHLRIKGGEHVHLMHSVRARLCWLLMQIVTQPRLEDYEKVFETVERFAIDENLYVRQYATFALMELARRRFERTASGVRFMSDELAARIKRDTTPAIWPGAGGALNVIAAFTVESNAEPLAAVKPSSEPDAEPGEIVGRNVSCGF